MIAHVILYSCYCRPGQDLKSTPQGLILFENEVANGSGWNLIFLLLGLVLVSFCQRRVTRASFAETVLLAKAMGTRAVVGGKIRTT